MGFLERTINILWRAVSDVWLSPVINGEATKAFKLSWGVRHGDPLSPCLFILAAEMLSHNLVELKSGQSLNRAKSCIYVSPSLCQDARSVLRSTSGSSVDSPPFVYLTCPLSHSRPKAILFEPIISKIQKSIARWHLSLLSLGGRLILLKHVPASMPVYACNPPRRYLT